MRLSDKHDLARRIGLLAAAAIAAATVAIGVSDAAGPTTAPGVGSGAIASDAAGNVAIGSNTTRSATKLSVIASSTSASSFALQVYQPGDASIFYVRNDGAVSIPGSLTVGTFTATIPATNVSAGSFGANTGGGNYIFPGTLTTAGTLKAATGTALTGSKLAIAVPGYDAVTGPGASRLEIGTSWDGLNTTVNFNQGAGGTGQIGFVVNYLGAYSPAPNLVFNGYQTVFNTTFGGGVLIRSAGPSFEGAGTNSLTVRGTATSPGDLIRTENSGGTRLLSITSTGGIMFPDGTTQTTAASSSATMSATNVSAGSFGANTGGGNYTFPASILRGSGTNLITLAASDAASGFWIRNDGSNVAFSSKVGDIYYGYAGRTGLLHRFGASGTAVQISNDASANALTIGSNGRADFGAGASSDQLRIGDTAGSFYYKIGRDSASSGDLYFDGTQSGARGYTFLNSENFTVMDDASVRLSVIAQGNNTLAGIQLSGRTTSNSDWFIDNRGGLDAPNDRLIVFGGGGERMTFLTGGNVGIGDTNPSYKLSVGGDINLTGALRVSGSAGTSGYLLQTTGSGLQWVATSSLGISGGGGSTIAANNVSAGSFGANTGGGNYTFPGTLTVSGATLQAAGNTSMGTHPTYGSSFSAFWRTGSDYALLTDGTSTYLNAPASGGTIFFRAANASGPGRMTLTATGLGIGIDSPSYKLDVVSGGAMTARIGTASGDTLTIGGGAGKINVGTIDPIYRINGEKFATYVSGMIGVKEEVAGELTLPCAAGRCERTIDFAAEPKGSDLWLFGKTTDIRKHLPQASVLLTPSFDGRVSYRKGDGTLTLVATPFRKEDSVSVSYRFTAPRFDADQWSNRTDDDAEGFVIND